MGSAMVLLTLTLLLAQASVQTASVRQPGEVRIRSAAYTLPQATIAVETNLVDLAVTVRDRKNTPIGGLQASDFLLFDNSKQQRITFFSEQRAEKPGPPAAVPTGENPAAVDSALPAPAATPPRSIALFFDDTHSGLASFKHARDAAVKLITSGLHAGDRVGLFTGSGTVTQDFTADSKILLPALASMRRHPDADAMNGFGLCPTLTPYQAYVISAHIDPMALAVAAADVKACSPMIPDEDAVSQAQSAGDNAWNQLQRHSSDVLDMVIIAARRLAAEPGTRILLMVSPGFVTAQMDRKTGGLIETCLRDHIVVNALDDEGLLGGGLDSPEALGARGGPRVNWAERTLGMRTQLITAFLADAAASTGGKFIQNSNDLTGGLQTLAAIPEVSYLLGFSPQEKPNEKYHKLKVTVAKANYEVSARPGYFSTAQRAQPPSVQQRIDHVVASGELINQFPVAVKVHAVAQKDGRYRIQTDISIDAKHLPFATQKDKSLQQLTFVTVLEDAAGNYLEGKQAVMDMALTSATRADIEAKGLKAGASFLAPKGSYRVREVIREAVHDRLAASNSVIEIH